MSRFAKLITTLFPNDPVSQRMALNFATAFEGAPQVGEDRIEALLREGARVNQAVASGQVTAEAGFGQLAGFAGTIGTPQSLVDDGLAFLQSGAGLTAEDFAAAEAPSPEPAQSPQAPAQAPAQPAQSTPAASAPRPLVDRDALRQQIAVHEKNMRAEPGSENWKAYWKQGGAEQYRTALDALQHSTDALAGLAGGTPAPAQPAAAPAPAPAAPVPAGAPAA